MKYALFLGLIFLTFCENTDDPIICTEQYVYGLNVIVKDAVTEDILVEGITVIAREDEYVEELMNFPNSTNFVGAGERAGNYIIEVNSDIYQDFTSETISVGEDACHVIPEVVEIYLSND